MKTNVLSLKELLDSKIEQYRNPGFIAYDPVCIPHQYSLKQDIEIAGFFAAIFSWGNRTTIIKKATELMRLMDNAPYDFVRNHQPKDLNALTGFRHRTFNATDLLYFMAFLRMHYGRYHSLEDAFLLEAVQPALPGCRIEQALSNFYHYFFSLEDPPFRTRKHIASPEKKSTCKRLNMFLRWMVRHDPSGIDFGLWQKFSPAQLICPIDVHVARVARRFGLVTRAQLDWRTALELTGHLRTLDGNDPVKYDFALFGLGAWEHY